MPAARRHTRSQSSWRPARARTIEVAEIARRLDERFGLLKAMRRGSDPRHRTMHDAISWSYDMLEPDEQELFTTLSVFAGPSISPSAGRMCTSGDTLDLLTRLTERSMLSVRPRVGGGARYELLETLRDYGRTRLGDERAAELYTEHASHFAAEAAIVARDLHGPAEVVGVERAESSFADMRSAQRFALDVGGLDDAFGIIASLREFAMRAMRYEVFAWADAACRVPGGLDHPLAPTAHRHARLRRMGARRVRPRRRARPRGPPPGGRARSPARAGLPERVLGNVLYIVGRSDDGNEEAARQLELAEESGDKSRLVHACYMASVALSSVGRYDDAAVLVRARATQNRRRPVHRPTWRRPRSRKASRPERPKTRSTGSSPPIGSPARPATAG